MNLHTVPGAEAKPKNSGSGSNKKLPIHRPWLRNTIMHTGTSSSIIIHFNLSTRFFLADTFRQNYFLGAYLCQQTRSSDLKEQQRGYVGDDSEAFQLILPPLSEDLLDN
jgi:hypothetical protein